MTSTIRTIVATFICVALLLPVPARAEGKGAGIGAAIGAGVAAGGTALIAMQYGENEGGEFCHTCFYKWGAFAIPTGAIVGATIGWGIDRARRPRKTVTLAPVLTKKSRGVFLTARF
jgi:hypothetical protein